jgi:alanine dehydrogenase
MPMKIGIPREIKDQEGRVAMTPAGVRRLVEAGHEVLVESGAGQGAGFSDQEYIEAGARLCMAEQAWDRELVLKVKEPLPSEYEFLRAQMLFTYLHLAAAPRDLTETLLQRNTTAIAYETLEDGSGLLPLLAPMSAIAGNMAALMGAYYLARSHGGSGVQLGQVLGVHHGRVFIIGDGVVARHAASSAYGLGADVVVAGLDPHKGERMRREIGERLEFVISTPASIAQYAREADLLVGAVLRHGARAEYVVSESVVKTMRPGSVIVDVSIDQGGCVETSRPTSHSSPVYEAHGVIHYCVTNMPGAYPRTSTHALSEAVLPYALRLAGQGLQALRDDAGFGKALNTYQGNLTSRPVAESLGMLEQYRPAGLI